MSNGYLTTHVLDTYNGTPGKGIKGSIFIIENQKSNKIKDFELNLWKGFNLQFMPYFEVNFLLTRVSSQ